MSIGFHLPAWCLACTEPATSALCERCRRTLVEAPRRLAAPAVPVLAAYAHSGAAVSLVHRLKYGAVHAVAGVLAAPMADLVPDGATALVPVPRAVARRWQYGIDPAAALAHAVGRRTGIPVLTALRAGVWWPRHAGRSRSGRAVPGFRSGVPVPEGCLLIDDVVTTGATVRAALAVLDAPVRGVLAASAAGTLEASRPERAADRRGKGPAA